MSHYIIFCKDTAGTVRYLMARGIWTTDPDKAKRYTFRGAGSLQSRKANEMLGREIFPPWTETIYSVGSRRVDTPDLLTFLLGE